MNPRQMTPQDPPFILRDQAGNLAGGLKLEAIDRIGNHLVVTGWCLGFPRLVILREQVEIAVQLLRKERLDVRKLVPNNEFEPGFKLTLAYVPGMTYTLRWITEANGQAANVDFLLESQAPVSDTDQEDSSSAACSQCHIDEVEQFTLRGWCLIEGIAPRNIRLHVERNQYDLQFISRERQDVAQIFSTHETRCGYEILLPGHIWSALSGKNNEKGNEKDSEQTLLLRIEADGKVMSPPCALSVGKVIKWIEAISQDDHAQQHLLFSAIEHLHHGHFQSQPSAAAAAKLHAFATRFGLHDYVSTTTAAAATHPVHDWATQQLWRALRTLNAKLSNDFSPEEFWAAFLETRSVIGISAVIARYCDYLVPMMCRLGLYGRMLAFDETHLERWRALETASDAWRLSIAIPAWLATKREDKVVAILWRLTKHLDQSWLNTECLAYASQEIMQRFLTGQIGHKQTGKYIYAYLGVLDAFKGNWHSRLTDHALMDGAVDLLRGFDRYTDHLQTDLVRGLLRHYGLMPHFWQIARMQAPIQYPAWSDARHAWDRIHAAIGQPQDRPQETQLISALRHFDRIGNPDARRYAREILGAQLDALQADQNYPAGLLLDVLLEEPTEGVRYAAFPLAAAARFYESHVSCGAGLTATLRGLTQRTKDPRYTTHRTWGARIAALAALLRTNVDEGREQASDVLDALFAEANSGDPRAADLASWLLSQPACCGEEAQGKRWAMVDMALAHKEAEMVPAAMQAALSRLLAAMPDALSAELRTIAITAFGDRISLPLPDLPNQMRRKRPDTWPGDTLVVIYSCRQYLDSRIAAIRASWVQDLVARGVPYLILIGDGKDSIEGDVLALDVSDRYEDLPQKTLKLIDWAYENTDFQYLYKIDDDGYLDVARLFENLSYRQHHYYGRVIRLGEGSMDRAWHQAKSHTEHAQKTLDKSPEPSVYADGGSGWVLSRWAMRGLREARASEVGQRLVTISLMEDKLVGDLLALKGIAPSDEEYESYQRRRTFDAAVPVGMWENLFYPTAVTPTVMCHLDTECDHQRIRALRESQALWPKKIWPTSEKVRLEWNTRTNQLELLSRGETLQALLATPPYVVAVMRNEMTLLPHFLTHYRRLGVGCFLIADNCSDDGTREYLLDQPDVALFSVDTEYKYSHFGVAWQQAILGNFCLNRWVVLADADEFLIYPDGEKRPFADWLSEIETTGANAVRVGMVDMYPDGELNEADFTQQDVFTAAPWFDATPLTPWRLSSGYYGKDLVTYNSALRHRIDPDVEPTAFVAMKTAVMRYQPWMRLSEGLHHATGVESATQWGWFAHFKYHAGFKAKVITEVARGQHFDNAKDYRRYQAMLAEGKGRFGTEDLSRRYRSSQDFAALIEETRHDR